MQINLKYWNKTSKHLLHINLIFLWLVNGNNKIYRKKFENLRWNSKHQQFCWYEFKTLFCSNVFFQNIYCFHILNFDKIEGISLNYNEFST